MFDMFDLLVAASLVDIDQHSSPGLSDLLGEFADVRFS
jgi:hypothetical protein